MAAPLVGANIATDKPGLAAGQAQIFDTSGLEKQIQDQIDLQRRRQDLQNQQDAETLNKIDLNGVRSADQSTVQQKYADTYSNFRKLQLAQMNNDRPGQIQAQSDLDKSKADLLSFIGQSKADNTSQALQYADIIHNRANYKPEAVGAMQGLINTPLTDPNYAVKSDMSQFVEHPPKVDLGQIADAAAGKSLIQKPFQIVKAGGGVFDQDGKILSFPIFKKNLELTSNSDDKTKDEVLQEYNPNNFDKARIAQLEATIDPSTGKPIGSLTTDPSTGQPLDPRVAAGNIYAADYWVNNHQHYDSVDRKQVVEKTPRAAGVTINYGNGGDSSGVIPGTNITTFNGYNSVPIKGSDGKTVMTRVPQYGNSVSTPKDTFTFPNIRVDIPNSPSIRDNSKGLPLTGTGVQTLVGSQMGIYPVYKSGPNVGNIVPDEAAQTAISNGTATYKVMFHANQGNVVGMSADGANFNFSKDPTPVYTPASNSVIQALQIRTSKDKLPSVAAKLAQMQAEVQKLNSGQVSTPDQTNGPTVKQHVKYSY